MQANNYLVIDIECTTFQKGHPFAEQNRLCLVGLRSKSGLWIYDIEYTPGNFYKTALDEIQALIDSSDVLVVFNGKFDLHWLRRYRIVFNHKRVYDCQLHAFIIGNQLNPFPSLNDEAVRFGFEPKLDVVDRDYWSQGIDTPDVPRNVLWPYTEYDLELTEKVYLKQITEVTDPKQYNLIKLANEDLLVLEEMEANGILFQWSEMQVRGNAVRERLARIRDELAPYCEAWPYFNWSSGDHLSCLLYGGTVSVDVPEPYEHTFKGGKRVGETVQRNKWRVESKVYPGLTKPIKGSELKKEGYYSTDEGTLKQLKGCKGLVSLLLEQAKLDKLLGTYYDGLAKLSQEMDWSDGVVHGQLNQCVVVTGRLSASKPNQQNFTPEIQQCIISRFGE